ncbi:hypothetical protein VCRA213O314_70093 [Vibrio crassostreae]|nr:hypothetical protein VCRA213O314_70093 [Vibrio crassostreae]
MYIHLMFNKDLGDYEFDPQKRTSGLHEFGSRRLSALFPSRYRYRRR